MNFPLHCIISLHFRQHEQINFLQKVVVILSHSSFRKPHKSSIFWGFLFWAFSPMIFHTFSVGFISGLCGGHFITAIPSPSRKQQLYGHLPPITKTIQVRRTRHTGHCWRSRNELISDVLLWTPSYGRAKVERPARTYIQQLYASTGSSLEDLLEGMGDREGWRERVREIHTDDMIG